MNLKMITLDMDDTLLNDSLNVSKRNLETLIEVQKQGVKVVLASGRPTKSMVSFAKLLQLDIYGGYIVSYNGAELIDCKADKLIYDCSLTKEHIHDLYDYNREHDIFIQTYIDGIIITDKMNKYTQIETELTGIKSIEVEDFKASVTTVSPKVIMLESHENLLKHVEVLNNKFGDIMNIYFSKPYFLEFTHKTVDKGQTIKYLAELLKINREDILSFGDGDNDLTMIEYAGVGVAMDNANDNVKAAADLVTTNHNEDGISDVILQMLK